MMNLFAKKTANITEDKQDSLCDDHTQSHELTLCVGDSDDISPTQGAFLASNSEPHNEDVECNIIDIAMASPVGSGRSDTSTADPSAIQANVSPVGNTQAAHELNSALMACDQLEMSPIPQAFLGCIGYLLQPSVLEEVGLFRVSGKKTDIESFCERLRDEPVLDVLGDCLDESTVCGTLKMFIRTEAMPLSSKTARELHAAITGPEPHESTVKFLKSLDGVHLSVLYGITVVLCAIVSTEANQMQSSNLGISIGPTLFPDTPLEDFGRLVHFLTFNKSKLWSEWKLEDIDRAIASVVDAFNRSTAAARARILSDASFEGSKDTESGETPTQPTPDPIRKSTATNKLFHNLASAFGLANRDGECDPKSVNTSASSDRMNVTQGDTTYYSSDESSARSENGDAQQSPNTENLNDVRLASEGNDPAESIGSSLGQQQSPDLHRGSSKTQCMNLQTSGLSNSLQDEGISPPDLPPRSTSPSTKQNAEKFTTRSPIENSIYAQVVVPRRAPSTGLTQEAPIVQTQSPIQRSQTEATNDTHGGGRNTSAVSRHVSPIYESLDFLDIDTDASRRNNLSRTTNTSYAFITSPEYKDYFEDLVDVNIPKMITCCIRELSKENRISTSGLFRKNGDVRKINQLKKAFKDAPDENHLLGLEGRDSHTVASLLKSALREREDSVLNSRLYWHWIDVVSTATGGNRIQQIRSMLQLCITAENRAILSALLPFLRRVCDYDRQNNMNVANIAVIFGPTLLPAPKSISMADQLRHSSTIAKLVELMIDEQALVLVPLSEHESQSRKKKFPRALKKIVNEKPHNGARFRWWPFRNAARNNRSRPSKAAEMSKRDSSQQPTTYNNEGSLTLEPKAIVTPHIEQEPTINITTQQNTERPADEAPQIDIVNALPTSVNVSFSPDGQVRDEAINSHWNKSKHWNRQTFQSSIRAFKYESKQTMSASENADHQHLATNQDKNISCWPTRDTAAASNISQEPYLHADLIAVVSSNRSYPQFFYSVNGLDVATVVVRQHKQPTIRSICDNVDIDIGMKLPVTKGTTKLEKICSVSRKNPHPSSELHDQHHGQVLLEGMRRRKRLSPELRNSSWA